MFADVTSSRPRASARMLKLYQSVIEHHAHSPRTRSLNGQQVRIARPFPDCTTLPGLLSFFIRELRQSKTSSSYPQTLWRDTWVTPQAIARVLLVQNRLRSVFRDFVPIAR